MLRSRLAAMLRQRCPRCREGKIFATWLRMHPVCPQCGLKFDREQGYFLGALYFSYPLSVMLIGLGLWLGVLLCPEWRLEKTLFLIALPAYLPCVPLIFRYGRVLWIYLDRWITPADF